MPTVHTPTSQDVAQFPFRAMISVKLLSPRENPGFKASSYLLGRKNTDVALIFRMPEPIPWGMSGNRCIGPVMVGNLQDLSTLSVEAHGQVREIERDKSAMGPSRTKCSRAVGFQSREFTLQTTGSIHVPLDLPNSSRSFAELFPSSDVWHLHSLSLCDSWVSYPRWLPPSVGSCMASIQVLVLSSFSVTLLIYRQGIIATTIAHDSFKLYMFGPSMRNASLEGTVQLDQQLDSLGKQTCSLMSQAQLFHVIWPDSALGH